MVNGPPTPPPTNAAELLDEARANQTSGQLAASSATNTGSVQKREDAYQHIFPTIANLASKSNFAELIQTAENGDLNGEGDHQDNRMLLTAPLVLAYLIVDNLSPAFYALTRLPNNLASSPIARSLMALLVSTWDRKHSKVYSRAESFFNIVGQPDFFNAKLASVIIGMMTTFVESFRQRTFVLLSNAYTSLPLALAQTYLGLQAEQVIDVAKKAQWSYDTSTDVLSPNVLMGESPASTTKHVFSSLSTFHFVADSVAKLEL